MGKALEPENRAKPDWWCPICETHHYDDYEAAKACVALGPPEGDGAAPEILVWSHGRGGYWQPQQRDATLEIVTLDKVEPDHDEGRHVLRYSNGSSATIGVGYEPGDVVEVDGRAATPAAVHSPDREALTEWLRSMGKTINDKRDYDGPRWPFDPKYGYRHDSAFYGHFDTPDADSLGWVGPLTDPVRDAFVTLLGDHWQRLTDVDPATDRYGSGSRLSGEWKWGGVSTHSDHASWITFDLRKACYMVACTHGFAVWDNIGVTRWLAQHRATVIDWLHDRLYRWVAGEDVTIPVFSPTPHTVHPGYSKGLPKTPNKRRVEALAEWGVDPAAHRYYHDVVGAALASIAAPAPTCPIPDLPDATTFRSL